jgi:hypothetical protein
VLRVRCDDPGARVPLGLKYGANPEEGPKLLALAKELGLAVVGVSFHVGSACSDLATFEGAIATARKIFDAGECKGHGVWGILLVLAHCAGPAIAISSNAVQLVGVSVYLLGRHNPPTLPTWMNHT